MTGKEGGGPPQNETIHPVETEPRHQEWWEVKREQEVGFVGDLNGSVKVLLKNLLELRYIEIVTEEGRGLDLTDIENLDEKNFDEIKKWTEGITLNWKGSKKRVVLLGDIIGDRRGLGDIVLNLIDTLREKGANIVTLFGNHDVGAVRTLITGTDDESGLRADAAPLHEYETFIDAKKTELMADKDEHPPTFYDLQKMYSDPQMVKHILQIKRNYVVGSVIDDTLFLHADVHPDDFIKMYKRYEEKLRQQHPEKPHFTCDEVIENMNATFQAALEQAFPEKIQEDGSIFIDHTNIPKRMEEIDRLCEEDELLSVLCGWPANRFYYKKIEEKGVFTPYTDDFIEFLQKRGINAYVFGHTPAYREQHTNNFSILPADGQSELRTRSEDRADVGNRAYANGKIERTGNIKAHVGKIPDYRFVRKLPKNKT